ncbi:MAG TPA: PstS family phosphate ABC transporter substrate-binding protein [Thermoleophilaceae bacterium]|nr:PstS family phosphate ABC transporter substrate-binding protein [Thermoleophilaceae bacterium]
MKDRLFWRMGAVAGGVALLVAAGATAGTTKPAATGVSGTITADGSSTVGPFTSAAAEFFRRSNRGARITVGISGTGGGFERFCRGETDLSNASRPIRYSEAARCQQGNVRYIQFLVANDGISLATSRQNTWANCLTTAELKRIWDRGSNVNSWNDVRSSFPNVPLRLYGAGTDSGTFEFFTEAINGRARQSRSDYTASEDDNVLVNGVAGDRGSLGYFGYSYYVENRNRLKVLGVDSGNGCRTPSVERIQNRAYKPLSRPLFVYAKRDSFRKPVVAAFMRYIILNEGRIARSAKMVPLTKKQLAKAKRQYNTAIANRNR